MLVLTRRIGEAIRIGPDILVYVSDIRGSQTRIGVAAPRDVSIVREELKLRTEQGGNGHFAADCPGKVADGRG
jgi:carbon storage regulator